MWSQEGYLAPVYAAVGPGAPSYLYSHHPTGKVPQRLFLWKTLIQRWLPLGLDYWKLWDNLVPEVVELFCFLKNDYHTLFAAGLEFKNIARLNKLTSPEDDRTCPLDLPEDK